MPRTSKRNKDETTNVDEVLDTLGVDSDLPPDAAALDHAARQTGAIEPPPEKDEEPEEEEEEEEIKLPEVVPIHRINRKEKPLPVPKKPTRKEPEPQEEGLQEIFDPLPFASAPPPVTTTRPKVKPKTPSTTRLGKALADKVPGAEHLKIYKRKDTGQVALIGSYTMKDLAESTDAEDFITRYIKPKFGDGEYSLKGVDAHGRELDVGTVHLMDPPQAGEAQGMYAVMQTVFQQQQEWLRKEQERMNAAAKPSETRDPVAMLKDLTAVQQSVSAEAKEEKRRAESAIAESSNTVMQMLVMMQQQQQQAAQQNMQLMMQMMQPREDPTLKMLLAKLVEEKSSGGALPPPPPPPPDPMEGFAKMLAAIVPLLQPAPSGGGGDDEYKSLLKEMVASRESERMTPKDILQMMQEMRQERGTDDFKKSADNLAMMLTLTNQMRQSTEGSASAGFWDALGALVSNRDVAGSIANSIRSAAQPAQPSPSPHAIAQQQAMMRQQAILARQREVDRARITAQAQAELQAAQAPSPAEAQQYAQQQIPVAAQPQPVQQQQPHLRAVPHPQQPTQSGIVIEPRKVHLPPLPANTTDYLNQIVMAKDEAELVENLVKMLMYLVDFPQWRPFVMNTLREFQAGNKRAVLQELANLLEGFSDIDLIDKAFAIKCVQTVNAHFAHIHKHVAPASAEDSGIVPVDDSDEEDAEEFDYLAESEDEEEEGDN